MFGCLKEVVILLVAFLVIVAVVVVFTDAIMGQTLEEIQEKARDDRTYWYDRQSLPRVYEFSLGGRREIYRQGIDIGPRGGRNRFEIHGSPINTFPWARTGGLHKCGDVYVKRFLWIPPGQKIQIGFRRARSGNNVTPHFHHHGRFPMGTVCAEYIYTGGKVSILRAREKVGYQEWQTSQYYADNVDPPQGYLEPENCQDCHRDAGKTAAQLDRELGLPAGTEWYGCVSGLEVGGPLHWHPWDWRSRRPRIRDDVRHLVETVRRR